jgi:signal transduction histidine kinase
MVEERTRELQEAHEKLMRQERLATMGQLAGSVGHELRNPLNVISSSVYLLNRTLAGIDEKSQEYLDIIKQETDKSAKIIKDLLDFGRISVANKANVKVSAIVAQTIARNTPPENIKVISADIPDTIEIMADAQQIGQVLDNLITNAFQAMPAGGKLSVKAIQQKGQVKLSVTDTGIGISKENMNRLFEPLFTTKARGIGLGLALSKNYVEANGGGIAVESEEDKGSTFTISFKLNE